MGITTVDVLLAVVVMAVVLVVLAVMAVVLVVLAVIGPTVKNHRVIPV
jgi:hypothetical protein